MPRPRIRSGWDPVRGEGEGVGKLQAPEAGLANHQGMAVGQAALAGQSAGHGDIQELSQSGQLLGGLGQQDTAAGVGEGIPALTNLSAMALAAAGSRAGRMVTWLSL